MASALLAVSFIACQDNPIDSGIDNPADSGVVDSEDMYYMAMRIYNASVVEGGGTRADGYHFDSDGDDYKESGKDFNIGLADENAIYTGSGANNFILVFSEPTGTDTYLTQSDEDAKLEYLMPMDVMDKTITGPGANYVDNNGNTVEVSTTADTSYLTFYTSSQKSKIPNNINGRKLLMVLNASKELKDKLQSYITQGKSYADVLSLTLEAETSATEKNPEFYSDYLFIKGDKKYFTMTSSMVVSKDPSRPCAPCGSAR